MPAGGAHAAEADGTGQSRALSQPRAVAEGVGAPGGACLTRTLHKGRSLVQVRESGTHFASGARWGRGTQVGSSRLRLLHGLAAAQERRAGDEGAKRTAVLPLSPAGSPEGRMQTHGGQQGHPGAKEATVVRAMRTRAAGNEAVPRGRPGPKQQGHRGTVAVICV